MKPAALLDLLRELYRDKATLRQRHAASARFVANYDFNNTYQYVINREDVQLGWLRDAIADLGGGLTTSRNPSWSPPVKGLTRRPR